MPTTTFRCDGDPPSSQHVVLPSPSDPAQEQELGRLDRDWEQEKAQYLTTCRDGRRFVAKPAGILAGGAAYLLLMACYNAGAWTVAAEQVAKGEGPPAFPWAPFLCLPLLGAAFTVAGVAVCVAQFRAALRYRAALRRYRERRAAITPLPRRQVPGPCQALGCTWTGEYWYAADALDEVRGVVFRVRYRSWGQDVWLSRDRVRFPEDEE
jgi:hypothetical protein